MTLLNQSNSTVIKCSKSLPVKFVELIVKIIKVMTHEISFHGESPAVIRHSLDAYLTRYTILVQWKN